MTKKTLSLGAMLGILLISTACAEKAQDSGDAPDVNLPTAAVAVLAPSEGSKVTGTIWFMEKDGAVQITGEVKNLTPGKHGFHIHEYGDLTDPEGKSAGGHYNPDGKKHGGPDSEEHHAGDLGNIVADEGGTAKVDIKADWLKVHFIVGRGLVVHAGEDDLTSQPSGDAGARAAVGVIGIAMPKD